MMKDPAIEAICEARKRICDRHGNDLQALFAHYMEYQKQFKGRLVSRIPSGSEREPAGSGKA